MKSEKFQTDEYGLIRNHPKFDGCELFVPYFYNIWKKSWPPRCVSENFTNLPSAKIEVGKLDIDKFPELSDVTWIILEESKNGVIWCYYD